MVTRVQIKTIQSLRHKKHRQKSGYFVAEGIKTVIELLNSSYIGVHTVFASDTWIAQHETLLETHPHLIVTPVTGTELKKISNLDTPQPVVALCHLPQQQPALALENRIILMLESLRDPGNLGTIIRIADWFGIKDVICSPDCVDAYNPKTIQASMGSIARVKVSEKELQEVFEENKSVPVYAATLQGKSITTFQKITEGVILIGNESGGLIPESIQKSTYQITIPRLGGAESLNAAVATGIICSRLML